MQGQENVGRAHRERPDYANIESHNSDIHLADAPTRIVRASRGEGVGKSHALHAICQQGLFDAL